MAESSADSRNINAPRNINGAEGATPTKFTPDSSPQQGGQKLSRRGFIGSMGRLAAGLGILSLGGIFNSPKDAEAAASTGPAERAEIKPWENQLSRATTVIRKYILPEHQGDLSIENFRGKISEIAAKVQTVPSERRTVSMPEMMEVEVDLSEQVPDFDNMSMALQMTPKGELMGVVVRGNLKDKNIPEENLRSVSGTVFNTERFKKAQWENEVYTREAKEAGFGPDGAAVGKEEQLRESIQTEDGLLDGALIAINPQGGFYLQSDISGVDLVAKSPSQ